MELRHLRYFVALAEHLSFTRAAARVHVTQSTLSHQIRQLEEEVGQPLFDRIGKKVVTTEAGELFLGFAVRALKEVDQGIAMLRPGSGGLTGRVRVAGEVRVATSSDPSAMVVTRIGPASVVRCSSPGPSRSASATAVATVACPQNATSASGLK